MLQSALVGRVRRFALAVTAAVLVAAGGGVAVAQVEHRLTDLAPEQAAVYTRGLQEELSLHGYNAGPVDGALGPRTRAAIRAYQRDAGLPVDGVATVQVLDHLKFHQPKVMARDGRRPSAATGVVSAAQRGLAARGYYLGAIDGIAGAGTRAAVQAFQRDAGLFVDGDVDEQLVHELRTVASDVRHAG